MLTRHLPSGALLRPFVLPILLVGAIALVTACSDDATRNGASGPSTSAPTSSGASPAATPTGTVQPTAAISAATPIATATVTPAPASAAPPAPTATPALPAVSLSDLAPCAAETYYSTITSTDGVPTLAYQGVPEGTPILFPFETGTVSLIDSSANGITVTYEVPGIGRLIVGAADTSGLNHVYRPLVRGQVIGHFGGAYPREAGQPMPGYQAYAQVISVQPGANVPVPGRAIEPQVGGCITP